MALVASRPSRSAKGSEIDQRLSENSPLSCGRCGTQSSYVRRKSTREDAQQGKRHEGIWLTRRKERGQHAWWRVHMRWQDRPIKEDKEREGCDKRNLAGPLAAGGNLDNAVEPTPIKHPLYLNYLRTREPTRGSLISGFNLASHKNKWKAVIAI
jgi:hypothetical protein